MYISNVPSVFLYVINVAFECFKSGTGVAHGMHLESRRGVCGLYVGVGDADVVERCLGGVGPRVDTRNEGETNGVFGSGD